MYLQNFSDEDRTKILETAYDQEPLFVFIREEAQTIETICTDKKTTLAENWTDAKTFVSNLCKERHPELHVTNRIKTLLSNTTYFSSTKRGREVTSCNKLSRAEIEEEIEAVLFYSAIIFKYLYFTTENESFNSSFNTLYENIESTLLVDNIDIIIEDLNEAFEISAPKDNYDYINNCPRSDKSGKEETEYIEKRTHGLQMKPMIRMMDCLWSRLGMSESSTADKAEFLCMLTGWSKESIYNKIGGQFDLTENHHQEDVERINRFLPKIGIKRAIKYDVNSKNYTKPK